MSINLFHNLLLIFFFILDGCTLVSSSNSDPLCQQWKFASIKTTTHVKDSVTSKKESMDLNEVGNLGPVKLRYNNDGSYEEEDVTSFIESHKSNGKWKYFSDKKKIVEVNETTGHTDTLTILSLSEDSLVLRNVDSMRDTTTRAYIHEY